MYTEKIVLAETKEDNYGDYYQVRCSPADIYWNGYTGPPDFVKFRSLYLERLSSAAFQNPEDRRLYLIQRIEEGEHRTVGFIQLIRRIDCVEIGYSVLEQYQKRGYAFMALKQAIELAKKHNEHICVRIRDDNLPSQKVALKAGFVRTETYELQEYPQAGEVKLRKYQFNEDLFSAEDVRR